jgi:signal recognition particle subunit SRP54
MFDALAERLEDAWKKLRGQDKISQSNIQEALKEVRRALLSADVNLQVVKDFVADVETKAQGAEYSPVSVPISSSSKSFTTNWYR